MRTVADTTPYPWPYDGELEPRRTALLVVGQGVSAPVDAPHRRRLAALVTAATDAGVPTVCVRHEPVRRIGPAAWHIQTPPGDPRLAGEVEVPDADHLVVAAGLDGFHGSALDDMLRFCGAEQLLLAGHGLETAVHSTLRSANDRGYECLLVVDACAPVDPSLRAAAVSMIEMSGGVFGAVGSTAAVVAALHPTPLEVNP